MRRARGPRRKGTVKTILPLLILTCVSSQFCLNSCGPTTGSPASSAGDHAPSGPSLYRDHCASCHGSRGAGSAMGLGPTLRGVAEHWQANSLEAYLCDPPGYSKSSERLGARPMPAWPDSLTAEERTALVDHTLGLMH